MTITRQAPPLQDVLAAFGLSISPVPLSGGQGQAFRAGNFVLKPASDVAEVAWLAQALPRITQHGFRLASYVASDSGALFVDGWTAQNYLEGEHLVGRWSEVIETSHALHRALIEVARPPFLESKSDPWAIADRMAWGEQPMAAYPAIGELLEPLALALRPIPSASQLIHGDLTHNVLFADGLPPAIIDFSPYWRPAAFAACIVVVDALTWHQADPSLLDDVAELPDVDQLLVRAVIWRLIAQAEHKRLSVSDLSPHRDVARLVLDRMV